MAVVIAIAWCAVLYLLVDAFRLRQRLSGLRVLRSATVQEDSLSISEDGADDYRVWCAEGACTGRTGYGRSGSCTQ